MGLCFVHGCNHRGDACGKKCNLFRFPKKTTSDTKKWETLCRRDDRKLDLQNDRICSCHFKDGKKENGPTIFPWNTTKVFDFPEPEPRRKRKKPDPTPVNPEIALMDHDYINECTMLGCELAILSLKETVKKLERELAEEKERKNPRRMTIVDIKDSNDKMLLFTSIPYDIFKILAGALSRFHINYYAGWKVTCVSLEDQLLVTLMKLRLNAKDLDLAHRFHVSTGTISNIVNTFITALHELLFEGIMKLGMPSQMKCKGSMPKSFQDFMSARVAMDATEITMDVPTELDKQSAAYSNYKSRHTVKSVTCVAPNAAIVYVSDLYPGSTSDNAIVEHCGMLPQFKPGDLLLADKGFTIYPVLPHGVNLNIPPFLAGKGEFTREEAKMCLKIARARIHVERANERIKNFEILSHVPANYRSISTKIFQVCCCLVNMQAPLLQEISNNYIMD